MKTFLKSKTGVVSILAFAVMMGLVVRRVVQQRHDRVAGSAVAVKLPAMGSNSVTATPGTVANRMDPLAANVAYLQQYYDLDRRARDDHDAQGNRMTRRETAAARTGAVADVIESVEPKPIPLGTVPARTSLRLQGKPAVSANDGGSSPAPTLQSKTARIVPLPSSAVDVHSSGVSADSKKTTPQRFNPYGRVLKCELVFTIDSTSEECPLVGVVMEPVYNNGALIIPAGAELHGMARPDRLRDRIFSGQEWVLVFPREPGRLSGRQLNVKGVALDRVEPDANGMTWGITDGSYGLEGRVIRTMNDEEMKRFVATFLAGSTVALQDRNSDRGGQQTVRNTPQNAVLQGLAANFEKITEDISAEIAQHGVFIRVPAGHQFYFYPTQIIDPDAAEVSSDIATAK